MRKILLTALAALVVGAAFGGTSAHAGGGCHWAWSLHAGRLVWVCGGYRGVHRGYYGNYGYGGGGIVTHHQRTVVTHERFTSPATCRTCSAPCAQAYVPPAPVGQLCRPGFHSVPPPPGHLAWCAPDVAPAAYVPPPPPPPQVILRSRG
jgi:hypothetical protein